MCWRVKKFDASGGRWLKNHEQDQVFPALNGLVSLSRGQSQSHFHQRTAGSRRAFVLSTPVHPEQVPGTQAALRKLYTRIQPGKCKNHAFTLRPPNHNGFGNPEQISGAAARENCKNSRHAFGRNPPLIFNGQRALSRRDVGQAPTCSLPILRIASMALPVILGAPVRLMGSPLGATHAPQPVMCAALA